MIIYLYFKLHKLVFIFLGHSVLPTVLPRQASRKYSNLRETFSNPGMPFPTLCGRERSISQRVVERADEQGHVLVPRTVGRPLTAGDVDVVVQPSDAVHH